MGQGFALSSDSCSDLLMWVLGEEHEIRSKKQLDNTVISWVVTPFWPRMLSELLISFGYSQTSIKSKLKDILCSPMSCSEDHVPSQFYSHSGVWGSAWPTSFTTTFEAPAFWYICERCSSPFVAGQDQRFCTELLSSHIKLSVASPAYT